MTSEANHTNSTLPSFDLSVLTWVMPLLCTLCVVGILANIYLIVTIYRRKVLRNAPTYVALTCLALVDAINLVFFVCAGIFYVFDKAKTKTWCQIIAFGMYCITGTSSYHLVIFSALRYVILVKPFFAMKYVTVKNTLCCCLICWLVMSSLSGLAFLTTDSGGVDTSDGKVMNACVITADGKYVEMAVFIVEFYIPIGFISGFHLAKWVHLKRRSMDTVNAPTQKQQVSSAIVFIIIILYIICYFPMSIYIMVTLTLEIQVVSNVHLLGHLFLALTPINSVLNPFVYFFFTKCFHDNRGRKTDTAVPVTVSSSYPSLSTENHTTLNTYLHRGDMWQSETADYGQRETPD